MSYKVLSIPPFDKQLKRLSKKYPSLKIEFRELLANLEQKPEQGTSLGNDFFKMSLAIASKRKDKSGGARIITCVQIVENSVYLLSIYDKSEQDDISNKELNSLLKLIP